MGERSQGLEGLQPDHVFDGGDLDCGSGLVLLIREQMQRVPDAGVLELRSREPTVMGDLPPWCRMVGHEYLGHLPGDGHTRYFVRRGSQQASAAEEQALADDKQRAREYQWKLRVRASGILRSTVYCRNNSFVVGQPASFEERDEFPCAVEYLLGALAADLSTGFATACSREGLELDDVEISIQGRLDNVLAHLGLEQGDPAFAGIRIRCFASTMDDEQRVRRVWEQTTARSPLLQTLTRATEIQISLACV